MCADMSSPNAVPTRTDVSSRQLKALGWFQAGLFAAWTLWTRWLARHLKLNQSVSLRLAVRVAGLTVPSCLFVWLVEGPPVLGRLGLTSNCKKGVSSGGLGFVALAAGT
jgi:hypothetical protein